MHARARKRPARPGAERREERGWRPPRHGGDFRIALAYPGPYRTGMSSLGFQTILYGFASLDGVIAGRVFIDAQARSLELHDAAVHPRQADILAFSVSAENDYPEILQILALARIPLRSRERSEDFPVVIAGGIAVSLNPEPLAEFMDGIALGEGEELTGPIVEAVRSGRGGSGGKGEILERLAGIGGVYVPALYRPAYSKDGRLEAFAETPPAPRKVSMRRLQDLERYPTRSRMAAPGSEFDELFLVEVNRGCGRGCRFCAAGHLMRPLRHRSASAVRAGIEEGSQLLEGIGLLGSAVADHPDIVALAKEVVERGSRLSLSSLRLDRLTPELLEVLHRGRCRTVTLAPETGSEKLRFAVGKRITDARILETAGAIAEAGIPNIKLYFMIGLPTEGDADREAITALTRKIRHQAVSAGRTRGRVGEVRVSLSCFVPKAWTPFQWHPFADPRRLKASLAGISKQLRKIPNVTVTHDLPKWAYVQALLSRGDRRVADILEAVHARRGDWAAALKESPLNPDYFVTRQRGRDELFPWDFIETGLSRERLWKEYRSCLAAGGAGEK